MFESLCKKLNIGNFIEYEKLTGGITNEVYKVITDNDIFVIKKIKDIDEENINRLEFSENISNKAKKQGLNVINALKFDNKYVQKVDDNYFLLYKFFPGKVYLTREINLDNVRSLASFLAHFHSINVDEDVSIETFSKIDFQKYYDLLIDNDEKCFDFFKSNFELLCQIYDNVYSSYLNLNDKKSYVHNDFNRKNVLWKDDLPYVIDFETSFIGNPGIDFFISAWFLTADVDKDKYYAYCDEYLKYFTFFDDINDIKFLVNASIILECNWLEFSLKRALGYYSSEEVLIGKDSIESSLNEIINYYNKVSLMIDILLEVLVNKYILENNNDGLFDLAFNYGSEIDLNKIALHFVDIKSSYDICELLSLEAENLDLELIFDEIVKTKDEEFIFLVYKSGVISSIIPDYYFGKLSEFLYH